MLIDDALREYIDIGEGRIFTSHTKEEDWINNWKEFFKPFSVENIIIKPTWEKLDCETKDKIVIEIDPGTAFGTGQHETTKLCILQLKKYINGQKDVLDVGCGSGILSIIANKLGAKYVFGTDIDERAVSAAIENADVNTTIWPAKSASPSICFAIWKLDTAVGAANIIIKDNNEIPLKPTA